MNSEKLNVVIVEDSALIRERLVCMLESLENVGNIYPAKNYEEALNLLNSVTPHVMIVDIGLPDKSGIELLRTMAQNKWKSEIIVFTNQANEYYKRLCFSLGAGLFLDKTKDFEKIAGIIANIRLT